MATSDADAKGEPAMRGVVEVFGGNLFKAPLLSSDEAATVVVRDSSGSAVMFLQRLVDDTWAFCHVGDDDWEDAKARFGVR